MAKWYFVIDGEQFGPVDPAALRRIAASGRLKPHDKVCREDRPQWFQAKQFEVQVELCRGNGRAMCADDGARQKIPRILVRR
ncbi:MAG: DUF4339 domain-containing protein [Planctomycetes bacterium]|nr:DUF4339 domain-containing protein [Planctomycetota bacterium]